MSFFYFLSFIRVMSRFKFTANIDIAPYICMPTRPEEFATLHPCLCFNSLFFASILKRSFDFSLIETENRFTFRAFFIISVFEWTYFTFFNIKVISMELIFVDSFLPVRALRIGYINLYNRTFLHLY
jgi:hypothetical protein